MVACGRPKGAPTTFALPQNNPSSKTKTPREWGEQREELFVASNYTTNYQLNQWEAGDQVLRTEFNQDNQKIDAALKNHDDEITGLATELTAGLAGKGNCHVSYNTYVGTGAYSSANPTSLTFPELPDLVIIAGENARYGLFCPRVNYGVCVAAASAFFTLWMPGTASLMWA